MCFFFGLASAARPLAKRYQRSLDSLGNFTPTSKINGFAQPLHPLVMSGADDFTWGHWGLTGVVSRQPILNARLETYKEKTRFVGLEPQRCLVPASVFYEWRHQGQHKIPYEIHLKGVDIFSMAGLYEEVWDSEGRLRLHFTLLTTQANALMQQVHNHKKRMPVVLAPEQEQAYLQGTPLEGWAYPLWDPPLAAQIQVGGLLSLNL